MTRKLLVLCFCIALTATFGCDGAKGRVAVSGVITVNGEPVPIGSINFAPIEGTQGPSGGAKIENGAYTLPAKRGVMPGKYEITIEASKLSHETYKNDRTGEDVEGDILVSILPPKYSRDNGNKPEVNLTADVKKGKNKIDFELTD